jgi:hypothetical protein
MLVIGQPPAGGTTDGDTKLVSVNQTVEARFVL